MGVYGEAAIEAAKLVLQGVDPINAWNECIVQVTDSVSSQKKSCPKTVFLTLSQIHLSGWENILNGGTENQILTIRALLLLINNGELAFNKRTLWAELNTETEHNQQLDVIVSVWQSNLFTLSGN